MVAEPEVVIDLAWLCVRTIVLVSRPVLQAGVPAALTLYSAVYLPRWRWCWIRVHANTGRHATMLAHARAGDVHALEVEKDAERPTSSL
jgi:hypothetical protein